MISINAFNGKKTNKLFSEQTENTDVSKYTGKSAKSVANTCKSIKKQQDIQKMPIYDQSHPQYFGNSLKRVIDLKKNEKQYQQKKNEQNIRKRKEKNQIKFQSYIMEKKKCYKQQKNCFNMIFRLEDIVIKRKAQVFKNLLFFQQKNGHETVLRNILFKKKLQKLTNKLQKRKIHQCLEKIRTRSNQNMKIKRFFQIVKKVYKRIGLINLLSQLKLSQKIQFSAQNFLPEIFKSQNENNKSEIYPQKLIQQFLPRQDQKKLGNIDIYSSKKGQSQTENEQMIKITINFYEKRIVELYDQINKKMVQKFNRSFANSSNFLSDSQQQGISFNESQLYKDLIGQKCHRSQQNDKNCKKMVDIVSQYQQRCQKLQQKVDICREKCEQIMQEMNGQQSDYENSNYLLVKALISVLKPL